MAIEARDHMQRQGYGRGKQQARVQGRGHVNEPAALGTPSCSRCGVRGGAAVTQLLLSPSGVPQGDAGRWAKALQQAAQLRDEAAGLAEAAEKLAEAAGITADLSPALMLHVQGPGSWERQHLGQQQGQQDGQQQGQQRRGQQLGQVPGQQQGQQQGQRDGQMQGQQGWGPRLQAGLLWAQGGAGSVTLVRALLGREATQQLREAAAKSAQATQLFQQGAHRCGVLHQACSFVGAADTT